MFNAKGEQKHIYVPLPQIILSPFSALIIKMRRKFSSSFLIIQ